MPTFSESTEVVLIHETIQLQNLGTAKMQKTLGLKYDTPHKMSVNSKYPVTVTMSNKDLSKRSSSQ